MAKEGRTSLFFVCGYGHGFLVPLKKCPEYRNYEHGGYPCAVQQCSADSTYLHEGGGYCGNCGAPVWRKNPWRGRVIVRVRTLFGSPEGRRMYTCQDCVAVRNAGFVLRNQFCAICGDAQAVSAESDQLYCLDCTR